MREISRRGFVAGMAVAGFAAGAWVTVAEAVAAPGMAPVPPLDGELVMEGRDIGENSQDAGNMVTRAPYAVLYPGSVADIQKMIRYCGQYGIGVATNTGKNSVFGQTLVDGGLVINGRSLNTIHSITPQGAVVDGGVLWMDLIKEAYGIGLTPAVITGYTQLGVAGTLSIGGLGAISSNRRVSQVDHIQELEVVTGTGELVVCSMTQNTDLFLAMCAGQGQCGVITRATVDMIPAPRFARYYRAPYTDTAAFFSDIRILAERGGQPGGFDWVASVNTAGPVGLLSLWAAVFYNPDSPPPPVDTLMRGCSPTAQAAVPVDLPYLDYVFQVDTMVDAFRLAQGWDGLVKPWFNTVLPDSGAQRYVTDLFAKLTARDVSPTTFVLVAPVLLSDFTRPLYRVPSGTWGWLCGVLTNSALPGPDPEFAAEMQARNYQWWKDSAAIGGTRYVEDAVPFGPDDWRTHFGPVYDRFSQWKRRFDPNGILGPGAGIF